MNRTELAELIHNGENSGVDFKRDDLTKEKLAKVMAAFLNLEGGHILLGVEDDGTVTGLTRQAKKAEEWVMQVAGSNVRPAPIPFWETIDWGDGKIVGVITLPADAPDKPYKVRYEDKWITPIRVGTTTRDATNEEEARLYMQAGQLQYDRKPVPGSGLDDFDVRRLVNYFRDVRRQSHPDPSDRAAWVRLLVNTEFMYEDKGHAMASAGGLLLFGVNPKRYLPQSGITAVAYVGKVKDYAAKARASLRGPLVSLFTQPQPARDADYPTLPGSFGDTPSTVEAGVIELALDFVRRNIGLSAAIDPQGQRQDRWDYPLEALREAVVNAVAHRDYTIAVMDIELSVYEDRLEIVSPGRLPNTVTIEKMRAGYRASRNELVKEVLRDYRYIEGTGLGVPRKIVEGMRAYNGTEPDFIEDDGRFLVRLWRASGPASA